MEEGNRVDRLPLHLLKYLYFQRKRVDAMTKENRTTFAELRSQPNGHWQRFQRQDNADVLALADKSNDDVEMGVEELVAMSLMIDWLFPKLHAEELFQKATRPGLEMD